MNVVLTGDWIDILNQAIDILNQANGYITFEVDNVTIIVADKENAKAMLSAVQEQQGE